MTSASLRNEQGVLKVIGYEGSAKACDLERLKEQRGEMKKGS
jgi:hypothetical protein